ncbi:rhodanese-like domain-containing protein [Paenibacillus sp. 1001270B_150601_E10]|uniref:rhodanese-like domain-containing protein n=1 Tax=Paenibacillus sp. 1001270B_150601_E10 TaxID=2787079 RepID=UPI00189E9B47|nr:rhodanese-like domain-containing protein [Paenibacillus sp. 1001270B_150601_E10]
MTGLLVMLAVVLISGVALYRNHKVNQEIQLADPDQVCRQLAEEHIQILDVRDPSDYLEDHLPNAVNIYIGRLPYVSKKELRPEDDILIVSSSKKHVKRATKILHQSGFRTAGSLVWNDTKDLPCKGKKAA